MSDETKHGHDQNPEIEFEREDLSPRAVFSFLIGLAICALLIYFILKGVYGYLDTYDRQHQAPQNPLVKQAEVDTRNSTDAQIRNKFPQPTLERNERVEINEMRLREEQTLDTYGWVDQPAGVVRIPIDRAMQLLAQRGLPTRPQNGATPPAQKTKAKPAGSALAGQH